MVPEHDKDTALNNVTINLYTLEKEFCSMIRQALEMTLLSRPQKQYIAL